MASNEARTAATEKLISIYNGATAGTTQQLEAITALGRVGGIGATKKLISIYDGATQGTKQQLTAIQALGEVGRSS